VGGVLTGLSLILAFYIILRDRWKDESSQARRIIMSMIHSMRSGIDAGEDITLHVENASDRPIRLVSFIAEGRPVKEVVKELKAGNVDPTLIARLESKTDEIGILFQEDWLDRGRHEANPMDEIGRDERKTFKIVFDEFPAAFYTLELSYTDANGMYWRQEVGRGYKSKLRSAKQIQRASRWKSHIINLSGATSVLKASVKDGGYWITHKMWPLNMLP
jgi:hypothetical protein